MAADTVTLAFAPAAVVPSDRHRGATGARPLGFVTRARPDTRMTFAGGLVTLGGSILVALAVPLMVVGLPVVALARLVLTVVRALSR